jgi:drug/metabolite transporter (DMT)-like permease
MSGVPVFSAVLGAWLLREQLTGHVVGGMVMAIVGVTLISLGGLGEARAAIGTQLWGDLLALLTTLCGAAYIVGGKRVVTEYNPLIVTTLAGTMGAVALLPIAVLEGLTLRLSAGVWVALLGLALGSGAAANWLWWYAANRLPVSRAGVFLYVTPVVSTALGIGILDEPLTVATVAGAGFVIGGVVFVQT